MRILVQRSNYASVSIDNKIVGEIPSGLVLLVGFTEGDNEETIDYLVNKVVNLRIFEDENGVMNKSILDYGGEVLSISQFTLYANTKKGNRPSYIEALRPEEATKLYDLFNQKISAIIPTKFGVFGADMLVTINNVGPTTIMLEK
ncbi:MAG: D-tyrosyl-tRNA(Tyr) deacylase [Firmicutes bacterium]|jgi:D-tyrosyl-tRNA(Tyr) deacylase|nr:D-tyrosyl-tRNA(Tyr) deacylase [Bacillota bacterium]